MSTPSPYTIEVPQPRLDEIRERVAAFPWERMTDLTGDWQLGASVPFLRRAAARWGDGYDWRAAERELNRFPHFTADVDGMALHYVHEVGSGEQPQPLLLIHGWPSSVWDFIDVIEPLAHPERFGGDPEDGLTVIAPSLPGYGWSGRPPGPLGNRAIAGLLNTLMVDVLGLDRYVAQGGDFGSYIAGWLGLDHPEHVTGIHVSALNLRPHGAAQGATSWPESFTPEEIEFLRDEAQRQQTMLPYAFIQATKPQSLAVAMLDSPVGMAAWILEKYQSWTPLADGQDLDDAFDLDRLLTQVMVYLVTDSFPTSLWSYPGLFTDPVQLDEGQRVEVPTAFAAFPDPLVPTPPRRFAERAFNITRWTEMPAGGHFAALGQPELLIKDIRAFVAELRSLVVS